MNGLNLSRTAVRHPALVLFMIITLALTGALSYQQLGRAEDPDFTIKVAIVSAAWPGATALEMRDLVADPVEKKLQEIKNLDRVETYTTSGFMASSVVFRDETSPGDVPDLFYQVRKKLADVQPELPKGVMGPSVNDEYGDVYSLLYMVTADGYDLSELKDLAEDIRKDLLRVADVKKVDLFGTQPKRIFVEFSHVKLATLGLEPRTIFDSLARQNAISPAGNFETSSSSIPVRVTGALDNVAAIEAVPVAANGRVFRLGDIADVREGFLDPPRNFLRQNGKPAIGIGVSMLENGNIIALGEALDTTVAKIRSKLPVGVTVDQIADQPTVVKHSINEFVKAFAEALGIVLIVSFISLGLRTGVIVALSVPLVLAIVFLVMSIMGIDLNRITLGALIIALGLLVDDAIIAIEMMMVKMEQGWDRARAAAAAWDVTAFPMLTGTLVTAAGFIPVGFARSAVAEYSGGIFWVVAISLLVSWLVAVIFTPYLGVKLLPEKKVEENGKDIYDGFIYRSLRSMLDGTLRHRKKVVAATAAIFVTAIAGFLNVQQQFFPLSERPELFLQLQLPEGSSIKATTEMVGEAEGLLAKDPDVIHATSYVGQGSVRFWIGLNPVLPNPAFAETVILSENTDARERIKARLEKAISEGALSGARVRVTRFDFGPPVGHPVQFRVIGEDSAEVRRIAAEVREVMARVPNVRDPHLQWSEMTAAFQLVVDQDRARSFGLATQDISQSLQTLLGGLTVTELRDGDDLVAVVARAVDKERFDVGGLGDLTIVSRNGVPVPLSQVARIEPKYEEPILWRRNRDLMITVRADVADGVQAPQISSQVESLLQPVKDRLPDGYRIETGGTIEESEKGNGSIFKMFPIMIVATLTILMVQLQSFSRLVIVLITAPLGIIGSSLALNLFSAPFGFVALLGQIALAGMIMRNSVILVDQIEANVVDGMDRRMAIVEAAVRRARPVVLTAMAAILAMIPLSRSIFWGPMAMVIMGGLLVATLLTLVFLPALYGLWFKVPYDAQPADPNSQLVMDNQKSYRSDPVST